MTASGEGSHSLFVLVRYPPSTGRTGERASSGIRVFAWFWPSQPPAVDSLLHYNTGSDATVLTVGELYEIKFYYEASFSLGQSPSFSTSSITNCSNFSANGNADYFGYSFRPTSNVQCSVKVTFSASGKGTREYTLLFGRPS